MNTLEQTIEQLFKGIETVFSFLLDKIDEVFFSIPRKKKEYDAEFVSPGSLLSSSYKGFFLGSSNLSVKLSYQNSMIVGATGSGKSSAVLLNSIYTMRSSFIINDPSGELYKLSAGYLHSIGYEIKVLDFTNPNRSNSYNPILRANSLTEIQKVASLLIETTLGKSPKDPFWNLQSISLLTTLISLLKKLDKKYQTLYNLRRLLIQLGGNPTACDSLMIKHADGELFSEYKSFLSSDSKVVSGVIASCLSALNLFRDSAVAAITSEDNLDFSELRQKRCAIFINNSVSDQSFYSCLTSLFFEQFFSYLMSRFPSHGENDIFLLIDECFSLTLPNLNIAVINCRKFSSGLMILLQSEDQLMKYGKAEAESIKGNCFAKLYFSGLSLNTTRELQQLLGTFEFENANGGKVQRPLMTADELRMLDASRALLICGNNKPMMVRLKPYYKVSRFKAYSQISAPQIQTGLDTSTIPTIEFEEYSTEVDA